MRRARIYYHDRVHNNIFTVDLGSQNVGGAFEKRLCTTAARRIVYRVYTLYARIYEQYTVAMAVQV